MPDDILARAEQAMEGVTEGPWGANTSEATMDDRSGYRFGPTSRPAAFFGHQMRRADAAFIAAARALVPDLVAAMREARAQRDEAVERAGLRASREHRYRVERDAAQAERDDALAEMERLWGELAKVQRFAGDQAVAAITATTERDEARAAIARVRALTVFAEASSDELRRALDGDA